MISKEQEHLAFLKLELNECQYVVSIMRAQNDKDLPEWEEKMQQLANRVFELSVLLGVEV